MPKRHRGELDGGSTTELQQQRLYLVFDDWDCGYSIRNVKPPLPCKSGDRASESERFEKRLPNPFWRYPADRECPQYFTSAFGTKIMGMHHNDSGIVLMIDVRTRSVVLGPRTNYPAFPIYFPVGVDKLFALDSACLELCRLPLVRPDSDSDSGSSSTDETDSDSESDSYGKWLWRQLQVPTFRTRDATSYAVHSESDGQSQSILVSVKGEETVATFTFDMGKFVWECLGEWTLPFTGRGHFDRKLKALVGLSKDPEAFEYLYACNMPSIGDKHCPAPVWKCSKEKVLSEHLADRHVSASLIYMENRCEYCIVECVWVEEDNADQVKIKGDKADQVLLEKSECVEGVPQRGRYMYRLMTFSLKYDKMDDLRVKCGGRVRYYEVPNTVSAESIREDPVAFWL
ncbi:unnamed protein product [Urochloa decumbens]|uniref:DUF1618 domain-containing protein n=1 Tax=Urochloa decumbens TaxID=240449 RepID=A0ABC8ZU27_9POAL